MGVGSVGHCGLQRRFSLFVLALCRAHVCFCQLEAGPSLVIEIGIQPDGEPNPEHDDGRRRRDRDDRLLAECHASIVGHPGLRRRESSRTRVIERGP